MTCNDKMSEQLYAERNDNLDGRNTSFTNCNLAKPTREKMENLKNLLFKTIKSAIKIVLTKTRLRWLHW